MATTGQRGVVAEVLADAGDIADKLDPVALEFVPRADRPNASGSPATGSLRRRARRAGHARGRLAIRLDLGRHDRPPSNIEAPHGRVRPDGEVRPRARRREIADRRGNAQAAELVHRMRAGAPAAGVVRVLAARITKFVGGFEPGLVDASEFVPRVPANGDRARSRRDTSRSPKSRSRSSRLKAGSTFSQAHSGLPAAAQPS